jgi:hypothetical protein
MRAANDETAPPEPDRTEALQNEPQNEPEEPEPPIGPSARPPLAVKKTLGPAMPPRAMLEAAALESTYAADEAVGPAPPEIVREVELVGAEARVAAAARVLAAARANGDAYDILGVEDIPGDDGAGVDAERVDVEEAVLETVSFGAPGQVRASRRGGRVRRREEGARDLVRPCGSVESGRGARRASRARRVRFLAEARAGESAVARDARRSRAGGRSPSSRRR